MTQEHDSVQARSKLLSAILDDDGLVEDTQSEATPVALRPLTDAELRNVIEGAILAAGQPLNLARLQSLFLEGEAPAKEAILTAVAEIQAACAGRGFELKEVASGWRFQVRPETAPWVNRLFDEKPQRYSRALLETLALIAYRQPITRGDIEEIRGVAVSSNIIKTLTEREWVKVVGHRDVPGRPALYATTRLFLDYFNLSSLDQLPSLGEISDLENMMPELNLGDSSDGDSTTAEVVDVEVRIDVEIDVEIDSPGDATTGKSATAGPASDIAVAEEASVSAADPDPDTDLAAQQPEAGLVESADVVDATDDLGSDTAAEVEMLDEAEADLDAESDLPTKKNDREDASVIKDLSSLFN